MSIRRHLFLLITGLVLVIALAQVALLSHFKSNVESEIEKAEEKVVDIEPEQSGRSIAVHGVQKNKRNPIHALLLGPHGVFLHSTILHATSKEYRD